MYIYGECTSDCPYIGECMKELGLSKWKNRWKEVPISLDTNAIPGVNCHIKKHKLVHWVLVD